MSGLKPTFYSLIFSCVLLFTFSCKRENPDKILGHISGYWEIEEVTSAAGESKAFTMNMLVDYIEINNSEGFRKKVAPQPDGTFNITDDAEKIEVKIENNQVQLHYSTPFDQWTETVLKADEHQLIVKNEDGIIYTYRRYEQINPNS